MDPEVMKLEKDTYSEISLVCGIQTQKSVPTKQKQLPDVENRVVVPKGGLREGGMDWEFGVSQCKLFHVGWINDKILL